MTKNIREGKTTVRSIDAQKKEGSKEIIFLIVRAGENWFAELGNGRSSVPDKEKHVHRPASRKLWNVL